MGARGLVDTITDWLGYGIVALVPTMILIATVRFSVARMSKQR